MDRSGGGLRGKEVSVEGICDIHRRFCEHLPEELLWVEDPDSGEKIKVIPGELRKRDIQVGRHTAISPRVVPEFMERFSLMSHAMLLNTLDTGAVWSIARGLAKNEKKYKRHLAECDLQRCNDLDGRGNLSEEALASFTKFFLETCIDQVEFMQQLIKPDQLRTRILLWADEEIALGNLPKAAKNILKHLLFEGSLTRNEIPDILSTSPRSARRITKALADYGIIKSDTPKSPWHLVFPAKLASRWMPGLFPE